MGTHGPDAKGADRVGNCFAGRMAHGWRPQNTARRRRYGGGGLHDRPPAHGTVQLIRTSVVVTSGCYCFVSGRADPAPRWEGRESGSNLQSRRAPLRPSRRPPVPCAMSRSSTSSPPNCWNARGASKPTTRTGAHPAPGGRREKRGLDPQMFARFCRPFELRRAWFVDRSNSVDNC